MGLPYGPIASYMRRFGAGTYRIVCVYVMLYSDLSPVDADNVFNREAVGRQSMSEKRKAYMDARLMNFCQHAKTVKGKPSSC